MSELVCGTVPLGNASGHRCFVATIVGNFRLMFPLRVGFDQPSAFDHQCDDESGKKRRRNRNDDLVCSHCRSSSIVGLINDANEFSVRFCLTRFFTRAVGDGRRFAPIDDRPNNANNKKRADYSINEFHAFEMGLVSAISSLGFPPQAATCCPNRPAISAHMFFSRPTAILVPPKQEDLKWLTTTYQSRHRTGPITTPRLARGGAWVHPCGPRHRAGRALRRLRRRGCSR